MSEKDEQAHKYLEAARDGLAAAEALVEPSRADPRTFLEQVARMDALNDHEDGCGQCHTNICLAEVAREMLAAGRIGPTTIAEWSDAAQARWRQSKYWKLWQEEVEAERDPKTAFEARGWQP